MKRSFIILAAASVCLFACKKSENNNAATVTSHEVITDFVNKTALPLYADLQAKATLLNTAVNTLNTAPNATNLQAARTAWQDVRSSWEQCEGFLIGPVEDENYDPNMDTWPVDYLQLDSFTLHSTSFTPADIQNVGQSLRGFHPLESILWGKSGNATADSITPKQKQYMVGLAQDVLNTVSSLNHSWLTTGGNFQALMLNAGNGSTRYITRKEAILAIVAGMSDICGEVGGGKIYEPFTLMDSTKTESPFSHNSIIDFTNNMKGAQQVYLCSYNGATGASISKLIAARNLSLDNKIKDQFAAAITALGNITVPFETAIHTQRTQLQNAMNAINTLQATLDGDAKTFVQMYVTD